MLPNLNTKQPSKRVKQQQQWAYPEINFARVLKIELPSREAKAFNAVEWKSLEKDDQGASILPSDMTLKHTCLRRFSSIAWREIAITACSAFSCNSGVSIAHFTPNPAIPCKLEDVRNGDPAESIAKQEAWKAACSAGLMVAHEQPICLNAYITSATLSLLIIGRVVTKHLIMRSCSSAGRETKGNFIIPIPEIVKAVCDRSKQHSTAVSKRTAYLFASFRVGALLRHTEHTPSNLQDQLKLPI